jgi:P-type Cu+ transporter
LHLAGRVSRFCRLHALPAFAKTTVELMPDRSGQFGFACGMNMVHGTLIVEPTNVDRVAATASASGTIARDFALDPAAQDRYAFVVPLMA